MLYLHIGLPKTGTTFFQKEIFPRFKGVDYIPWTRFETYFRPHSLPCLISRESLSGGMWSPPGERDANIKAVSEVFASARILISFRRHEGYIASTYKQYVHQGGILPFSEYFRLNDSDTLIKRENFMYSRILASVLRHFSHPPFVFFYEEIRHHLEPLLADMALHLNAKAPAMSQIRQRIYNKGLPYYSALILRRINKVNKSALNPSGRWNLNNKYTDWLHIDPQRLGQYWLSFLPDRPLLEADEKREILRFYQEDWQHVISFARSNGRHLPEQL